MTKQQEKVVVAEDELELDVEVELDEELKVDDDVELEADKKTEPSEDDDDDEIVITIGDTPAPEIEEEEKAPTWVRELRKSNREIQRENRDLKKKLEAQQNPEPKQVELGKKPALSDFGYDTDEYETALTGWHDQKRKADDQAALVSGQQKAQKDAWEARLGVYGAQRDKLKVKDYEEVESYVTDTFDQTQQGIVIQGAENSALVFLALHRNPDRSKELAALKDPVQFAFAVAKLEKDLKVGKRKAPPAPERKVTGTGPSGGTVDSTLDGLREKAEKTGDYTAVAAYKRKIRKSKT